MHSPGWAACMKERARRAMWSTLQGPHVLKAGEGSPSRSSGDMLNHLQMHRCQGVQHTMWPVLQGPHRLKSCEEQSGKCVEGLDRACH
eukprot:scaffold61094_cov19-Tisochrysis_lutea.AAC.1